MMNIYVNIKEIKFFGDESIMTKLSELGAVLDEVKAKQDEANAEMTGMISTLQANVQALTEQLANTDAELSPEVEAKLQAVRDTADQMANFIQ